MPGPVLLVGLRYHARTHTCSREATQPQGMPVLSALLKSFGAAGEGVFAAPTAVEDDVRRMYGVAILGRDETIRERFYAISVEKRLQHPAVVAISKSARTKLFRS